MAGYSKTPLARKLGIKPGSTVYLINGPANYAELVEPLPEGTQIETVSDSDRLREGAQFIHLFAADRETLDRSLPAAKSALAKDATLWISWPKQAAKKLGVETDLDGGQIRAAGLATGLVDVKVCAVDEVWSGHKFVYRLADR
ncbi:MAG: DUF3052 domain-containing protein [Thermoanaerobaculia bacterium]|nr:DUF3052 domain-containing protein [Thermoanaerobaculia bacterium]